MSDGSGTRRVRQRVGSIVSLFSVCVCLLVLAGAYTWMRQDVSVFPFVRRALFLVGARELLCLWVRLFVCLCLPVRERVLACACVCVYLHAAQRECCFLFEKNLGLYVCARVYIHLSECTRTRIVCVRAQALVLVILIRQCQKPC